MIRVLCLSSGRSTPSSRFRVQALASKLRAAGHVCTVAHSLPGMYDQWPWLGFRLSRRLKYVVRYLHWLQARIVGYDAVVLERQLFNSPDGSLERLFRKLDAAFVLDIDDAVFLHFPEKLHAIAEYADLIFAGNRSLAEWSSTHNSNVVAMPTCIDTALYQPRPSAHSQDHVPVVGWMGTSSNIPHLATIAEALRNTAAKQPYRLRIVSNDPAPLRPILPAGVETEFVRWTAENELRDLSSFDIGIMPLVEDEWSRYKCGAKLLQYMASAIPSIASPVGVNREIIEHAGNGFLASDPNEWTQSLRRLLRDRELRARIGRRARETVVERYSLEQHFPRWLAAVEAVVRRRRGASKSPFARRI